MSMNTQESGARIRPIQHNVVRPEKLSTRHDLEAQAQDMTAIHRTWIRIEDLEGRHGVADAVEALLDVGFLLGGSGC
jgi:hypothetical protein